MKTTKEEINYIFSQHYTPDCHPSRIDDIKAQMAIKLLAEKIDILFMRIQELNTKLKR